MLGTTTQEVLKERKLANVMVRIVWSLNKEGRNGEEMQNFSRVASRGRPVWRQIYIRR